MKSILSCAAGALLIGQSFAHPVKRQEDIDVTVLQFALTLEHLENVFYKQALETLSEQQFMDAGYEATYYSDIKYIASDEEQHVKGISAALEEAGVTPNAACEYDFPFTDVASFITLSSVLEGVGTSAYLGAADLITSKEYLTVAGSILAVEALHTSRQRLARGLLPFANPYYTPLDPNPVFTLASSFIVSCPPTNAPLPFMAFPALTVNTASPVAQGTEISFSISEGEVAGQYATFVSGLTVASVMIPEGMHGMMFSVAVPESVAGQSYVFVTKEDLSGKALMDAAISYGPAIIEVTADAPVYDIEYE